MSISNQSLASLVTTNYKAAAVLEKYNLDFCCKGKRSLKEACEEKNLSVEELMEELQNTSHGAVQHHMPFEKMTAGEVISYILLNHHFYAKQALPRILQYLQKIAAKHGDRFPYMVKVLENFAAINEEVGMHMDKEEMILFPRIKELEKAAGEGRTIPLSKGYINAPIQVMQQEHEYTSNLMHEINQLTNNYTAPENACNTFKIALEELKAFEEDLHKHVHLENYVLFPKAEQLSKILVHE